MSSLFVILCMVTAAVPASPNVRLVPTELQLAASPVSVVQADVSGVTPVHSPLARAAGAFAGTLLGTGVSLAVGYTGWRLSGDKIGFGLWPAFLFAVGTNVLLAPAGAVLGTCAVGGLDLQGKWRALAIGAGTQLASIGVVALAISAAQPNLISAGLVLALVNNFLVVPAVTTLLVKPESSSRGPRAMVGLAPGPTGAPSVQVAVSF